MNTTAIQYAPGDLRVSDADRDRAVAQLSEHFQAGRLTLEEFDERSGQALRAKTARELTDLFTDLPATQGRTADAVALPEGRPHPPAARVVVAAAAIGAAAIIVSVLANSGAAHRGFALPVPLLVLIFIVVRLVTRRRWRRVGGPRPGAPVQDR
jgi:hypothetical protein